MLTIIGPNGFERVNSIVSYRGENPVREHEKH
jgi:hypothetical protein